VAVREKNCETREFVELGRELKKLLGALEVPLIVNDRVDVAIEIGAMGFNIGQQDMEYERCAKGAGPRPSSGCRSRQTRAGRASVRLGSTISAWAGVCHGHEAGCGSAGGGSGPGGDTRNLTAQRLWQLEDGAGERRQAIDTERTEWRWFRPFARLRIRRDGEGAAVGDRWGAVNTAS